MATVKKPHRNEKFRKLLLDRFHGVQVDMADALGISPSLVHRYAFGGKGIGEDMKALVEEKLNLSRDFFDLDENTEHLLVDLTKASLEKLKFMQEIVAMNEDEFREKAGAFQAIAAVRTQKESNGEE